MTNEVATYQPKPRNAMMIKNLCPGLMEMGKIKIGNKGAIRKTAEGREWQAPQKLDHFLITTMERGKDNNFMLDESLHRLYGEEPKSIPVRLIYDDASLDFATRYICYYGKKVFCSGDGEEAQRTQKDGSYKAVSCPCGRQDPKYTGDDGPSGPDCLGGKNNKGKCKINGILSAIIDGAQSVGGVWKFRTTSYNSVVGILSSLALIQRITGGRLAGIPMNMTVTPKTVQDPILGNQQTIYVVGLQYAGTVDSLRETGYQIALTEAKHGISMSRIEEDARLMLTHTPTSGLGDDPDQDVIEEFYPEEARPSAPDLVDVTPATSPPTDEDPALVGVTETVDMATGEVVEGQPVAAPAQKRHRRTKTEIEADRLAAETQTAGASQPATTAAPDNEEDWPDPLGAAGSPEPLHVEAQPETATDPDGSPVPDLVSAGEPPHPADATALETENPGDLF